jgi:hypothetical protein
MCHGAATVRDTETHHGARIARAHRSAAKQYNSRSIRVGVGTHERDGSMMVKRTRSRDLPLKTNAPCVVLLDIKNMGANKAPRDDSQRK